MSRDPGRITYRIFKWVSITVAGLLAITAVAVAALLFLVDPAIFRDDLEDLARQQGVALHLRGELNWRFYPQLQIITTDTALGAIDAAPLAELERLAVSVALRPLLRSELQVTGVTIEGLRARFEVDEDGNTNWDAFIKQADTSGEATAEPEQKDQADDKPSSPVTIDQLKVVSSQILYINRQTAQTASIHNLGIVIEQLGQTQVASPIALRAKITASDPTKAVNSDVAITSALTVGDNFNAIELQRSNIDVELHYRGGDREIDGRFILPLSLSLNLKEPFAVNAIAIEEGEISYSDNQGNRIDAREVLISGRYRPGTADAWQITGHVDATLPPSHDGKAPTVKTAVDANATVTLAADTNIVTLEDFRAQVFPELSPLQLTGSASVQTQPLSVRGQMAVANFNPLAIATALSLSLPPRADPQTLTNASLRSNIIVSDDSLRIEGLTIKVDDTTAKGTVSLPLSDANSSATSINLHIDQLDLDRYLAPVSSAPSGDAESTSAPSAQTDWDLSALSDLALKADFKADRLSVRQLPFSNIELRSTMDRGSVSLSSLQGQIYNSPFQLTANLNATANPYRFQAEGQATKLPLGKLLADLQLEQRFSGNSDITFQLTSQGNNVEAVQQALNGTINVTGRELTLSGINIERAFCRLVTAVQKQSFSATEWADITHFADTTTQIRFKDGVARIEKLNAGVSQLAVSASGKVDLRQSLFDVVFNTQLASRDKEQAPCAIDNPKLLDRDIPIRCKASFDGIDVSTCLPDMRVAEDIAKEKIKDKIDDKAKSFLEDKLGEEKSKAAEQLFKQLLKPSGSKTPASKDNDTAPAPPPTDNESSPQ